MYCAWGTPSSMPMAAGSGLGALFIPQKSWAEYAEDMRGFNAVRAENGWAPMKPIVATWVYCHEDEKQAWDDALLYMGNYSDSARRHYEFDDSAHFHNTKGYEHYAQMSEAIACNAFWPFSMSWGVTHFWNVWDCLPIPGGIPGMAPISISILYSYMPSFILPLKLSKGPAIAAAETAQQVRARRRALVIAAGPL